MSSSATKSCVCVDRQEGGFNGWNDFDAFVKQLASNSTFEKVPVTAPYSNVGLKESWYRCMTCHKVWRLVEPDPPFRGLWAPVT